MKLRIHHNKRVTLNCEISDLAMLLCDAAKSMRNKSEPLKPDVIRLADEIAAHMQIWIPDAAEVELGREVREAMEDEC